MSPFLRNLNPAKFDTKDDAIMHGEKHRSVFWGTKINGENSLPRENAKYVPE